MAIEYGDLWRLANTMAGLAESENIDARMVEPLRRVAINRAYYATYHRALQLAVPMSHQRPTQGGESSHTALWLWFKEQGGSHALIGNVGFSVHRRRKIADYEIGAACPSVKEQIEEAELIADTLKPLEDEAFGPTE